MNGVVEPAALEIVAHAGRYHLRKRLLFLDRVGPFKHVDTGWWRLQCGLEQRSDRRFQFGIQILELGPGDGGLERSARDVVGMAGIADMLGDLALQGDGSLEHRREGGKVVVGACLDPDRRCPGPPLCRFLHQAGRDAGERSDRFGCVVHRPLAQRLAGHASKFRACAVYGLEHGVAGRDVTSDPDQRAKLPAACLRRARRHHGARIPDEQVHGAQNVVDLGDLGFECGVAHLWFLIVRLEIRPSGGVYSAATASAAGMPNSAR